MQARSKVWVCEGRYGRMSIELGGRALRWREIAAPVPPQGLETAARPANPRVPISVKKRKWSPATSHPWHSTAPPERADASRGLEASYPRLSTGWPYVPRPKIAPPDGLRGGTLGHDNGSEKPASRESTDKGSSFLGDPDAKFL